MRIHTELLQDITVSRFQRMRPVVDLNPAYQRESNVWKAEARGTLIDSIINGLDVPKLYFETMSKHVTGPHGLTFQYAVIDGKQRLESILAFLSDDLALPQDFLFFEDEAVKAAEMKLTQLRIHYPALAQRFLNFELPIVKVTSDSGDLIEEMFQRLNASTALNAAERRNALAGPTRESANFLADHQLLVRCSPIRSARYKYRELGAKVLVIEHQINTKGKITDTKAATLYDLFVATRGPRPRITSDEMQTYEDDASSTLDLMAAVFDDDDRLLSSIGTVVVYYITFRDRDFAANVDRDKLSQFEELRRSAAGMAEDDPSYSRPANARLREYNVFVQSTNDGRALTRRAEILAAYIDGYELDDPLIGLDDISDGELPEQDETES